MVIALDIGGTKIRIAEVKGKEVSNKVELPTPKKKKEILETIVNLIEKYPNKSKIGIGIAAYIKNEKINSTPNMDFNKVQLKKILKSRFPNSKIKIENDANCAGIAESEYGHGKKRKNFVLITLGTGVGGAVFVNGRLYKGNGYASELGDMRLCEMSSLENISSGTYANNLARKNGFKDNFELSKKAKKGNILAIRIFSRIGENLGVGLFNLAQILDPEVIIIGGGFSNAPYVIPKARSVLHKLDPMKRKIPVLKAKLRNDVGLIGAGALFKLKN